VAIAARHELGAEPVDRSAGKQYTAGQVGRPACHAAKASETRDGRARDLGGRTPVQSDADSRQIAYVIVKRVVMSFPARTPSDLDNPQSDLLVRVAHAYRNRERVMFRSVLLCEQSTDLNVPLTAELKSHNASDGGIAILAKSLFDLVANAPGDEVTLKKADNHWAEIKSGKVTYRIVACKPLPTWPDRSGWPRLHDPKASGCTHPLTDATAAKHAITHSPRECMLSLRSDVVAARWQRYRV
jgi:hypothetical protein